MMTNWEGHGTERLWLTVTVLSRYSSEGTEDDHFNLGQLVARPKFEPGTS
jgi:hypothetical protein